MAGRQVGNDLKLLRPIDVVGTEIDGVDSDADDEEEIVGNEVGNEMSERLALPREEEIVRKVLDPKLPTQEEVDVHNTMGHLPYRNWCPVCVRAKGRDMDHKQDDGKERLRPESSLDYCFPGDELGFKWTVLV